DHFADLVLDRAKRRDRLPELSARGSVLRRLGNRSVGASAAGGAQLEPSEVEDVERDLVALPDFAEDVFGGYVYVLEDQRGRRRAVQAHLVFFFAAPDPERPLDEKRGELIAVDFGEDDEQIGEPAVGDPHLLAVQDEAPVRLTYRACACAERVGPRSRFAQSISAVGPSREQLRQVLSFLLLGAEQIDRNDGEICRG